MISTCRRHEIDRQVYLTQLLVNRPGWPVHDLDAWLPDQRELRQAVRRAALQAPAPSFAGLPSTYLTRSFGRS